MEDAYDVEDGSQEINQDGGKDDDVPGQVGFINPTAGFAEDKGQTLIVLCRGDEDQRRVHHDENGELDGHWHQPAGDTEGGSRGHRSPRPSKQP